MNEALLVSNALLWIAVIALGLVVVALTRQIGLLHERLAPAGALAVRRGPEAGEEAPELELRDVADRPVTIGGASGERTLLFFLSPTCPVCKTLLPTLRRVVADESPGLRLVFASDGPPEEHEAFRREHRLEKEPYVLSTELGVRYGVAKLPMAFLIDAGGIVRAKGIVNTREHLESLFEAEERGVGSIQELARHEARLAAVANEGRRR